jgi:hypothetical protein
VIQEGEKENRGKHEWKGRRIERDRGERESEREKERGENMKETRESKKERGTG